MAGQKRISAPAAAARSTSAAVRTVPAATVRPPRARRRSSAPSASSDSSVTSTIPRPPATSASATAATRSAGTRRRMPTTRSARRRPAASAGVMWRACSFVQYRTRMSIALSGDAAKAHAARLHFLRGLTKSEIADRLGVSRFKVARMLEQARAEGIVRVEIREPVAVDDGLGAALEAQFGLALAVVVRGDDPAAAPAAAADWLPDLLGPRDVLGVAWGTTLQAVLEALPPVPGPPRAVVQICGAVVGVEPGAGPSELVWRFAERLGGRPFPLPAPAVTSRPGRPRGPAGQRGGGADRGDVRPGRASPWSASAPCAGDGRSSLLTSGALSAAELADLRRRGAVGDLVVHVLRRRRPHAGERPRRPGGRHAARRPGPGAAGHGRRRRAGQGRGHRRGAAHRPARRAGHRRGQRGPRPGGPRRDPRRPRGAGHRGRRRHRRRGDRRPGRRRGARAGPRPRRRSASPPASAWSGAGLRRDPHRRGPGPPWPRRSSASAASTCSSPAPASAAGAWATARSTRAPRRPGPPCSRST